MFIVIGLLDIGDRGQRSLLEVGEELRHRHHVGTAAIWTVLALESLEGIGIGVRVGAGVDLPGNSCGLKTIEDRGRLNQWFVSRNGIRVSSRSGADEIV